MFWNHLIRQADQALVCLLQPFESEFAWFMRATKSYCRLQGFQLLQYCFLLILDSIVPLTPLSPSHKKRDLYVE